jgi:hypothetical protein
MARGLHLGKYTLKLMLGLQVCFFQPDGIMRVQCKSFSSSNSYSILLPLFQNFSSLNLNIFIFRNGGYTCTLAAHASLLETIFGMLKAQLHTDNPDLELETIFGMLNLQACQGGQNQPRCKYNWTIQKLKSVIIATIHSRSSY